MTKGVTINGRSYKQGSHVEYASPVGFGPAAVARGRVSHLATINMFYTFGYGSDNPVTFVELSAITTRDRISDGVFVVEGIERTEALLSGFTRAPSGGTTIEHIDSLIYQVKLVEHFSDPALLCAIRMWEAV
jgi:hypothetical protein